VSNPVKDRSGRGLPSKAERRAAGREARIQRARVQRRNRILKNAGSALAVVVVVAAVAVACTKLSTTPATPASSAANPAASAPADGSTPSPQPTVTIDPAFDQSLHSKPTVTGGTGDVPKLVVTTIVAGPGAVVKSGQTITVNYVGVTYADGKEFDSSWSRSQPASFQIGTGSVIPGWDQGLVGVKIGSRVQLDIPTDLAYGADAAANGNPAGPLRFVVDILAAA
jgi:peptidylprolyl isomerase